MRQPIKMYTNGQFKSFLLHIFMRYLENFIVFYAWRHITELTEC